MADKKLVNTGGLYTKEELNLRIRQHAQEKSVTHSLFGEVFEQIGGVDRMARWAAEEPGKFYPLFARVMTPQEQSQNQINIQINAKLAPGPLDE